MGWFFVGAMLLIAAFVYVAAQAVALLARGTLFVAAAVIGLISAALR